MKKEEAPLTKLFWIDMEMTGLDEKTCHILEVAAVVTDINFNVIGELHRVVQQPRALLEAMDDWCKNTHGKSGLTKEVESGTPLKTVEAELIAFAKEHFKSQKVILCGNSVGQDRRFIDAYMPKFSSLLHYRIIDVSSFKEVFFAKYGAKVQKKETHRAKDDIYESIHELKTYLTLIPPSPRGP